MAITDDFNRGTLGANWSTPLGTAWVTSGSTVAKPVSQYADTCIRRTEAAFPNDQYAQVDTEDTTGGDGTNGGVAVRMDASGNGYFAVVQIGSVLLKKRVAGSNTAIGGQTASTVANTLVTLKLVVTGTTLTLYVNGVLNDTVVDTSLASGNPGCWAVTGETAFLARFDNFESTDASAASSARPNRFALLGVG